MEQSHSDLSLIRRLSPQRNTTQARDTGELVAEQLAHFGIDAESEYGRTLGRPAERHPPSARCP